MRKTIASLAVVCFSLFAASALGRPQYPIDAADYRKAINTRVESIWGRIEKKLDFYNVTPDRKRVFRRAFDGAAKEVWVEVGKASADGMITRAEALKIRVITAELRGKVRSKLAAERKAGKAARKSALKTAGKPAPTRPRVAKSTTRKADK